MGDRTASVFAVYTMAKKKGNSPKKGGKKKKAAPANKPADDQPAADDAVLVADGTEEVKGTEDASPVSSDGETAPAPESKADGDVEAEECV